MKRRLLQLLYGLRVHHLMRLLLRRRILVLAYHGFTDKRAHAGIENSHGKHINIDVFRSHVEYLKAHYDVIPLQRLVDYYAGRASLPPRPVVLTIDDGYESTYRLAYPVLKPCQVPATVFLTTDFVDGKQWLWTDRIEHALSAATSERLDVAVAGERFSYDLSDRAGRLACDSSLRSRLKAADQEGRPVVIEALDRALGQASAGAGNGAEMYRPLDWEQVREMMASGLVSVGGHTVSHVILTRCSAERARHELAKSKQIIEARTGEPCTLFCYPNGQRGCFDSRTRALLLEFGYTCGVTTVFGTNDARSDVYELKRLYFDDRGEFVRFVMTLSGVIGFLNAIKHGVRRTKAVGW